MCQTISITIPYGKELAEMPKDVIVNNGVLSYSLKYERKGNTLIASREINYLKDTIMPDQYEELRKIVSQIYLAETKEIALK